MTAARRGILDARHPSCEGGPSGFCVCEGLKRTVKAGNDGVCRVFETLRGGGLGMTGTARSPHGVGERHDMAHKRLLEGLVQGEMFGVNLGKSRGRVRVESCDGRDGVTGGPALCVQVLHRLHARPINTTKQVGGAVGEVSESLSSGNGVEDGSEQMGTKEMRCVAGQAGGVILDGSGPQGRRVRVDPLANVFPSEGGKTGFVVFKDVRTEITLRRVSRRIYAAECPEEGEATGDVRTDLHRSGAAPPGEGSRRLRREATLQLVGSWSG